MCDIGTVPKSATLTSVLIGRRIKKLRSKNKWTLDTMQEKTRIHKTNLGRIENGMGCREETLIRIADALGVTYEYLKWGSKSLNTVRAYCIEEIISDEGKCVAFLDIGRLPKETQKWAFDSLKAIKQYIDSQR